MNLLQVQGNTLQQLGAVSAEVAEQMAEGTRRACGTTWGLSVTGIAGPGGGTPEKPVGLVYFGLAGPQGVQSLKRTFGSRPRDWIRVLSQSTAIDWLRRTLQ